MLDELVRTLEELQEYRETHKIDHYGPYPFQERFHNAVGHKTQEPAVQKALMAANQVGKSFCSAMEISYHATGLYPDWWGGQRFDTAVDCVVGSSTNETARDICQKELLGDPSDKKKLGTGTIPKPCIGEMIRKPGVPNALDTVLIKHISGKMSKINFRAYEQGKHKWMGHRYDVGWADEEPPEEIWAQMVRSTISKEKSLLLISFTPENGVTKVVDQFMNDIQVGQSLVQATWFDADHISEEMMEQRLAAIPPHEREMRMKGVPLMGSGMVFPIPEDQIKIEPFEIPNHWARICGIDFGWDHPFGAVWLAHDRDTDTVYVYDAYKESKVTPPIHASAIKKRGPWIPIVWPHDGYQHDKGSGVPLAQAYRAEGLNLLKERFTNPPGPGMKEGSGGNGVEVGITDILTRMETGRFKVFSNLSEWWEEWRMYHRKDGKIVAIKDDLMSATRYADMSLRFAYTQPIKRMNTVSHRGLSNW